MTLPRAAFERCTFVHAANVALFALLLWQPIAVEVWSFRSPLREAIWVAFGAGWLILLLGACSFGILDLLGIEQMRQAAALHRLWKTGAGNLRQAARQARRVLVFQLRSALQAKQDRSSMVDHESQCLLTEVKQFPRVDRVATVPLSALDARPQFVDAFLTFGNIPVRVSQVRQVHFTWPGPTSSRFHVRQRKPRPIAQFCPKRVDR